MSVKITDRLVTVVGNTFAEVEPFIRYANDIGLTVEVGRNYGRGIGGDAPTYPTAEIEYAGEFDSAIELIAFLLTIAELGHAGSMDQVIEAATETARLNISSVTV